MLLVGRVVMVLPMLAMLLVSGICKAQRRDWNTEGTTTQELRENR